jgi:putative transposase
VESKGDAYVNALAESVIGLFKTEVIRHAGPWKGFDDVELATLKWVWWFYNHCLMEALRYLSPAEYVKQSALARVAPVAA